MADFLMDKEAVDMASRLIANSAEAGVLAINNIIKTVNSLSGKDWIGTDNGAYVEKLIGYKPTLDSLISLMNKYSYSLSSAVKTFSTVETENTAATNKL